MSSNLTVWSSITLIPSGVRLCVRRPMMGEPLFSSIILSIDHATSSAVSGLPSCHLTLGRRWKVYSLISAFVSQLSASRGISSQFQS